jgi:hypothetical protein
MSDPTANPRVPFPDPTPPVPHILTAVDEIMNEVSAMGKDGYNQQQRFPFRSYDGVINAVGPAFRRHRVAPSYKVTSFERRTYTTGKGTGMMETLVRLTYTLTSLVDGSTFVLAEDVPGESADAGDKSASKAVTVACRLALLHGLAIPTQEADPDEQTVERAATGSDAPARTRKASRPAPSKPAADPGSPATSSADGLPPCPECGDPLGDHTVKRHTSGAWMHRVCPRDKKGKA